MSLSLLLLLLVAIAAAGFALGRSRVLAMSGGDPAPAPFAPRRLRWHVAVMALVPSLLALLLWVFVQPLVIEQRLAGYFPADSFDSPAERSLLLAEVRRVAGGLDRAIWSGELGAEDAAALAPEEVRARLAGSGVALGADVTPEVLTAARDYRGLAAWGSAGRTVLALAVALLGAAYAARVTAPDIRARNRSNGSCGCSWPGASMIAILTTVAIVLSLLTESIRFFQLYPWQDFFFGLTWNPNFRGNSDLGLLPLLWGTLYITAISMAVSVPVGLFAAIYLAEYASERTRAWVKPLIEVIAGIPTVVFGLFALVYVGPALRDWFAEPLGLGTSGASVMTAGWSSASSTSLSSPRSRTTSSTPCPRRCATAPTGSAPRRARRSARWCCRPRCRASWARSSWPARAPSARR
jgi:phosphate transport system permease protein